MPKLELIAFPGNEVFTQNLARSGGYGELPLQYRKFPDHESYFRFPGETAQLKGKELAIVCTLDRPDSKVLPLLLLASFLKDSGVKRLGLICPYLAYMRQDKVFHPGEAVTSTYFGRLISERFDWLVTVDPHLHRRKSLSEIYSIPNAVVHAAPVVAAWLRENTPEGVLIGPDAESAQWVSEIARKAGLPFEVLLKKRLGDRDVRVSLPHVEKWRNYHPVLVDDIVSSGHTMEEPLEHLLSLGLKNAVCVAIHPVFSENSYAELKACGAARIVSCDTIPHESNGISVEPLLVSALESF